MRTMAFLFAFACLIGSASAGSMSATTTWNGGYGFPSPEERLVDLQTATTNYAAQIGTLGLPGNNYISTNNITNIGTAIEVDNENGNVDLDAEQHTNIGSQKGGGSNTVNAGDGKFDTGNVLDLD